MQKRNLIHKLNTKILCILILFVLIYITVGVIPQNLNISYGATSPYTKKPQNTSLFFLKFLDLILLIRYTLNVEILEYTKEEI